MLRSLRFDPKKDCASFRQLQEKLRIRTGSNADIQLTEEDKKKITIESNTHFDAKEGLFVAFLGSSLKRDVIKDYLQEFSGDHGLTCKREGNAVIKSASSQMIVTMKIGYNDQGERILHVQNEVSFLGGDKTGKIFRPFVVRLANMLYDKKLLKDQDNNYQERVPGSRRSSVALQEGSRRSSVASQEGSRRNSVASQESEQKELTKEAGKDEVKDNGHSQQEVWDDIQLNNT